MKNFTLILISFIMALFVSSERASSKEMPEINKQIEQLDVGTSGFEEAVRILGEPAQYIWGNRTFTKDNLPATFIAVWKDRVNILISQGTVNEIRFESPRSKYLFMGRIGVGSKLEDVLEVVGRPKEIVENEPIGFKDGILYKDIEGRKGACYYARSDKKVRMFFRNNKVTALYLTRGAANTGSGRSFLTVRPISSVKDFDDVRFRDMSKLDLSERQGLIHTLTFNNKTVWPPDEKLPAGRKPQMILRDAMNPGLGVRRLHEQGITGKGVNVAIIDQPLFPDHPEFKGKIIEYFDTGCGSESSMHGPAVASLLVGTNCGTAPGARLYYAAAPSWLGDSAYYGKALDWIMEKNAGLADVDKIRAVSVSAAPSGRGSPFSKNNHLWEQARSYALKEGILVLDCTTDNGFIGFCWYDPNDPEDLAKCSPGFPGRDRPYRSKKLLTPCSIRTTAEQYEKDKFSYQYTGRGGLSWGIPYATGVLALGWQVNPDLTAVQARELLFESAYSTTDGQKIINPGRFLECVKSARAIKTE
ncbi:MAG: S8 family serine peptidase [Planctomycetota bacterium]